MRAVMARACLRVQSCLDTGVVTSIQPRRNAERRSLRSLARIVAPLSAMYVVMRNVFLATIADSDNKDCRFHVLYPGDYRLEDFRVIYWRSIRNDDEDHQWDMAEIGACEYWEQEEIVSSKDPIEQKIANHIFHDMRSDVSGSFCTSCHPRVLPWDDETTCCCDTYGYFVQRWRCIPCVLEEATKATSLAPRMQYIYDPRNKLNSIDWDQTTGMIRVSAG